MLFVREQKEESTLTALKVSHLQEMQELQTQLTKAAASQELEDLREVERSLCIDIKSVIQAMQTRHDQTKRSMLVIVLRHWVHGFMKMRLAFWKQKVRDSQLQENYEIARGATNILVLSTFLSLARVLWRDLTRWSAMQHWATQSVAAKQSRRLSSFSARLRQSESAADQAEMEKETALRTVDELTIRNEKLSSQLKESESRELHLEAIGRKLKQEHDKLKRNLRLCKLYSTAFLLSNITGEDKLANGSEQLSKNAMQLLIKLHGVVLKQYSALRSALELGKLHSEGRGESWSGDAYGDTLFEKARAATTAVEMLQDGTAMINRCTQGFMALATEVETARFLQQSLIHVECYQIMEIPEASHKI